MCIGIPMRVIEADGFTARCAAAAGEHVIDICLTSGARPGDWLMVFLGAAREIISEDTALATIDALAALDMAMRGETGFDHLFADLIGREPELPDHLKATAGKA